MSLLANVDLCADVASAAILAAMAQLAGFDNSNDGSGEGSILTLALGTSCGEMKEGGENGHIPFALTAERFG